MNGAIPDVIVVAILPVLAAVQAELTVVKVAFTPVPRVISGVIVVEQPIASLIIILWKPLSRFRIVSDNITNAALSRLKLKGPAPVNGVTTI